MSFRVCMIMAATTFVVAAANPSAAQQAPKELTAVTVKFATAVAAKNLVAAAALTRFPLANAVYRAPKSISRAGFADQFRMYTNMTACLKSTPPKRERTKAGQEPLWSVDCDGNVFYFRLKDGHWLHSKFENVNE